MDFTKIFIQQEKLDNEILFFHKIKSKEDIREKKIIALIVEIGEFANEFASFKYWKKNHTIIKKKMIEEFVDGIHFFCSLALDLNLQKTPKIKEHIYSLNVNDQLKQVFYTTSLLFKKFNLTNLKKSLQLYLGLANLLNISEQEIFEYYFQKKTKNLKRILDNY